jgi:hypothetical protein
MRTFLAWADRAGLFPEAVLEGLDRIAAKYADHLKSTHKFWQSWQGAVSQAQREVLDRAIGSITQRREAEEISHMEALAELEALERKWKAFPKVAEEISQELRRVRRGMIEEAVGQAEQAMGMPGGLTRLQFVQRMRELQVMAKEFPDLWHDIAERNAQEIERMNQQEFDLLVGGMRNEIAAKRAITRDLIPIYEARLGYLEGVYGKEHELTRRHLQELQGLRIRADEEDRQIRLRKVDTELRVAASIEAIYGEIAETQRELRALDPAADPAGERRAELRTRHHQLWVQLNNLMLRQVDEQIQAEGDIEAGMVRKLGLLDTMLAQEHGILIYLQLQEERRRVITQLVARDLKELDLHLDRMERGLYSTRERAQAEREALQGIMERMREMRALGTTTADQIRARIRELNEELERTGTIMGMVRDIMYRSWADIGRATSDLFYGLLESAGGALDGWKELWREFRLAVVRTFERILADIMAQQLMEAIASPIRRLIGVEMPQLASTVAGLAGPYATAATTSNMAAAGAANFSAQTMSAAVSAQLAVPAILQLAAAYQALNVAKGVAGGGLPLIGGLLEEPLPALQHGGIVTRPTVAMLGERGPEAVVPLDEAGGAPINITIQAIDTQSGADFLLRNRRELAKAIDAARRDVHRARGGARW